jgi:hypothetical protein
MSQKSLAPILHNTRKKPRHNLHINLTPAHDFQTDKESARPTPSPFLVLLLLLSLVSLLLLFIVVIGVDVVVCAELIFVDVELN